MYEGMVEKGDEESETVSSAIRDAPVPGNAAVSAARVRQRKSVTFSPLVSLYNTNPHSVVYGVHPMELDLDEKGRMVSRQCSHPAPHSRELGYGKTQPGK